MIIIIFGAPCIGKSLIANCLAERLNVSNVLQTDIVEIVMRDLGSNYFSTLRNMDEIEDEKTLIDNFN
jgi:2-phosphoglycerate kinase